jgi:alcohol dehydrogenase class IV
MERAMRFEYHAPTRILFGPGVVTEVPPAAKALGERSLVLTGRDPHRAAPLVDRLKAEGMEAAIFPVPGEPSVESVRAGVAQARAVGCDVVIGFGGGSVLDAGKAVAALLTNGGDPTDYLEVVGKGRALARPSAPYIAIPTTAGTGAEVTRNAVLTSSEYYLKASLRSAFMYPRLAVVDPELTHALPPAVTAPTGLDALTQLIEPFVSTAANPLTDALCRDGIIRIARSLRRAWEDGRNATAREDMALASLFSGIALANAKLGAVHGCAAVLGGRYPAPHGAVCARLLPFVMAANVAALHARSPGSAVLRKYEEVARLLTGRPDATIADGIRWAFSLSADLGIPPLGRYGLVAGDLAAVVMEAQRASSTKGNPVALTDEELADVLRQAL